MFISCHFPDNTDIFILYDKDDFDVEKLGLNLEDVQVLEPTEIMSKYDELPILNLNDFLLRTLRSRERTTNKILIDKKESKFSSSQRRMILKKYNEILSLTNKKDE